MTVRAPIIGTDTDSAETFRLAMGGLWVPTSALNARTGVTSTPVLTGTGNFSATGSAFTAVIDGTSNSLQGCYPVANDAPATITIGAANTQPRIDLISLQIQDTNYDGTGQTRCIPVVTPGIPAGSPTAPPAPANSLSLWTVPVAANATSIVFSSATAVYPRTAAAGGIVPVAGATDKPAAVNGVAYRHRLDVAAGGTSPLEYSTDGVTYTPVAGTGPQKIFSTTLATTTASVAVTIPSGYTSLEIVWSGRVDGGGVASLYVQCNGDTGTNYQWQYFVASLATQASNAGVSATGIFIGELPGSGSTTNYFGSGAFTMAGCSTSVFKSAVGRGWHVTSPSGQNVGLFSGQWLSTAAITSLTLSPAAGNFVAGSTFTVYGLS
jgi:hypothetical protein